MFNGITLPVLADSAGNSNSLPNCQKTSATLRRNRDRAVTLPAHSYSYHHRLVGVDSLSSRLSRLAGPRQWPSKWRKRRRRNSRPNKSPAYREIDGAYIKKPASPPATRLLSETGGVLPPDSMKVPRIHGRSTTPHPTSISFKITVGTHSRRRWLEKDQRPVGRHVCSRSWRNQRMSYPSF